MNQTHKKALFLVFAVSAAAILVYAVFHSISSREYTQPGSSEQKNPVKIWAWDDKYNIIAAEEAVRAYQKRYPDTAFEIVSMTQEEIKARLKSAMITGSHKFLPDIVLIEDYSIQYFLQNYESEFLPLNSIVSQDDFVSCKTGVNHAGDTIYGVPFDCGTIGLFYRLDVIQKAGFTEQDMRRLTWEDYIEVGKKVRETTGMAMLSINPTDLPLIRMMLQSAGAWYTDEEGKLYLEGNQVLAEAVRLYREIVNAGIALTAADWNRFVHDFWEGNTASILTGSWISISILEEESQKGLWRMAEVPRMKNCEASVNASSIGGSCWYVLKYAGMAGEARHFLGETFASDTGLMDRLAEKIHLLSALKSAQKSMAYQSGQPFYGGQMIYQDLIYWTNRIPSVNYGTDTYKAEEIAAEAMQQVLAGRDIEEVLAEYQREYGQLKF